jgi:hypothetical protein
VKSDIHLPPPCPCGMPGYVCTLVDQLIPCKCGWLPWVISPPDTVENGFIIPNASCAAAWFAWIRRLRLPCEPSGGTIHKMASHRPSTREPDTEVNKMYTFRREHTMLRELSIISSSPQMCRKGFPKYRSSFNSSTGAHILLKDFVASPRQLPFLWTSRLKGSQWIQLM